ncbi:uncharacterized protein LOC117903325 [Drosophila subobscura]|uniref:uncharacterized protein LOC117903325 n=1 Tax=Drosophila subobscura TaxID=7241 RepID=UPI00155A1C28|nr:uncharacterized protein LOC117903325 [Drosophila subobscura]
MEALVNYSSEDDQEEASYQIRLKNSPRHHHHSQRNRRLWQSALQPLPLQKPLQPP